MYQKWLQRYSFQCASRRCCVGKGGLWSKADPRSMSCESRCVPYYTPWNTLEALDLARERLTDLGSVGLSTQVVQSVWQLYLWWSSSCLSWTYGEDVETVYASRSNYTCALPSANETQELPCMWGTWTFHAHSSQRIVHTPVVLISGNARGPRLTSNLVDCLWTWMNSLAHLVLCVHMIYALLFHPVVPFDCCDCCNQLSPVPWC